MTRWQRFWWRFSWTIEGDYSSYWFDVRLGLIRLCGQRNSDWYQLEHCGPRGGVSFLDIGWLPLHLEEGMILPTWRVFWRKA